MRTQSYRIRAHSNDLIINLITSAKTTFPNKVKFTSTRGLAYLFGGPNSIHCRTQGDKLLLLALARRIESIITIAYECYKVFETKNKFSRV